MGLFSGLKWIRDKVKNNSGVLSVGAGLATLGYNIFSGERSFREQNRYNDLMMGREDDAVQRRVEDLKKAGLSPVLAAGSPASASAVKVGSAPQVSNSLGDSLMDYARFEQDEKFRRIEADIAMQSNQANLSKTQAEVELLNAQRDEVIARIPLHGQLYEYNEMYNPYRLELISKEIENQEAKTINERFDSVIKHNTAIRGYYDIVSSYLAVSEKMVNIEKSKLDVIAKAVSIALDQESLYDKRLKNALSTIHGMPFDSMPDKLKYGAHLDQSWGYLQVEIDNYLNRVLKEGFEKSFVNDYSRGGHGTGVKRKFGEDDRLLPFQKPGGFRIFGY